MMCCVKQFSLPQYENMILLIFYDIKVFTLYEFGAAFSRFSFYANIWLTHKNILNFLKHSL